jgi:hypothetical protein
MYSNDAQHVVVYSKAYDFSLQAYASRPLIESQSRLA